MVSLSDLLAFHFTGYLLLYLRLKRTLNAVTKTSQCLQVPPKIADKYVNLLIVGESGLGKTTFIRNCFSDLLHEDFELSDASWGSMSEFKDSPSVFCTHLPAIEVPEALIRLRYSVQDVPGCTSSSSPHFYPFAK